MARKSLAWFVFGVPLFAFSALGLAACSASGTGLPSGSNGTNSDGSRRDGGEEEEEEEEEGDGGSRADGSRDAAEECGTMPQLRPRRHMDAGDGADGGPFMNFLCPFSASGSDPWLYCDSGTHCCVPYQGGGLSICAASCPAASDGGPYDGRDIECLDPIDCTVNGAGPVCCGTGQSLVDPACGNRFGKGFTGTRCATSCDTGAGEWVLCQKQEHCSSGTCTPMSASGAQFGICL